MFLRTLHHVEDDTIGARVLIDGHNAMAALKITGPTHEAKRHALLRLVGAIAPDGVVFFDARRAPDHIWDSLRELEMEVVYCRDREADTAILDAVRDEDRPETLMVVSNDREVTGKASQLGARVSSVAGFFGARRSERSPPPSEGDAIRKRQWKRLHMKPKDFGLPDEVDLANPSDDLKEKPPGKKKRRKR